MADPEPACVQFGNHRIDARPHFMQVIGDGKVIRPEHFEAFIQFAADVFESGEEFTSIRRRVRLFPMLTDRWRNRTLEDIEDRLSPMLRLVYREGHRLSFESQHAIETERGRALVVRFVPGVWDLCDAAEAAKGKLFAWPDAPKIPLKGCRKRDCGCSWTGTSRAERDAFLAQQGKRES
ncbi:hypothetical protein [Aurantimonas sp. 22II-16-19i]|uniref:hypothetical protein n=1 Tax=Aurantimonas sp. 22II-16-19i TaxID=1317114 RepID=UPI00111C1422|nr:hypothetical protein [Aurantimonas sp. 22II-16-19i]